MSDNEIVHRYTRQFSECCRHVSLDPESTHAIRKLVCLNLRATSPREFYAAAFASMPPEERFVDWDKIAGTHRFLQDSQFWITMLKTYCDVKAFDTTTDMKASIKQHKLLVWITESLVRNRITVSWKDTVFLFLLINIARAPSLNISKLFLSGLLGRDVDKECVTLIGDVADARYTNDEFLSTMRWILNECIYEKTEELGTMVQKIQHHNLGVKEIFAVRALKMTSGRLRLRDRLAGKKRTQVITERNTFESFQADANFASNVSYHTKLRLYMLMSQRSIDKAVIFDAVFPDYLRYVLEKPSVESPDVAVINETIGKIRYMQAPFPLLSQFYEQCFKSIAFTQKNAISLSTIMQLYVSIYQDPKIWQECWTFILPVMNSQVVRDVDIFRQKHPVLDNTAFAYALNTVK